MVFKLACVKNHTKRNTDCRSAPLVSDSVYWGRGSIICFSNKSPGNAADVSLETTIQKVKDYESGKEVMQEFSVAVRFSDFVFRQY